MRYTRELHGARHEPIIPKTIFDTVQEVIERRSKPRSQKLRPYLYRGFFHCGECRRFITTETQKGHNYLRCTKRNSVCFHPCIREEAMAEQTTQALRSGSLPEDWVDWMVVELKEERRMSAGD